MSANEEVLWCGLDIGGTLAKLAIFVPNEVPLCKNYQHRVFRVSRNKASRYQEVHDKLQKVAWIEEDLRMTTDRGSLLFLKFLSAQTGHAKENIKDLGLIPPGSQVFATGGGAYKFFSDVGDNVGLKLSRHDEMESLMRGLVMMARVPGECFSLKNLLFQGAKGAERDRIDPVPADLHQDDGFLVVNIGTGVSFVHCSGSGYQRVGGSSLGGSTFLGLCALLTGEDNFDRAIDLASHGDSAKVDILLRDIYGEGKDLYGLRPTTLASSFGKMISRKARETARPEDLALSALIMCSMNVAALAHLHAKNTSANHIVFSGSFLACSGKKVTRSSVPGLRSTSKLQLHRHNRIAMRTLAYAVSFWSKGERTAIFFKHDSFLGALGALSFGLPGLVRPTAPTPMLGLERETPRLVYPVAVAEVPARARL